MKDVNVKWKDKPTNIITNLHCGWDVILELISTFRLEYKAICSQVFMKKKKKKKNYSQ